MRKLYDKFREEPESDDGGDDEEMDDSNAQDESQLQQQHSNGLGSNLPMMRRPARASVEEKPVDIEASPTSEHVIPGTIKITLQLV